MSGQLWVKILDEGNYVKEQRKPTDLWEQELVLSAVLNSESRRQNIHSSVPPPCSAMDFSCTTEGLDKVLTDYTSAG